MNSKAIRLGLVGVGKIARDQHIPALRADSNFELVAAADQRLPDDDLPMLPSLEAMLDAYPDLNAVALCTPPQGRGDLARLALARGKHVLLEKPPAAGLGEVEALRLQAKAAGLTLFTAWHSRFAAGVEPARLWLADRRILSVRIDWREDVRVWHPGQAWIWRPGGLGVFDPGINELSIATAILPSPFFLTDAELRFPSNREAPITADLTFGDGDGLKIEAGFDWLQTGPQRWNIEVGADGGLLQLSAGGAQLSLDGQTVVDGHDDEYPRLYHRFAELIAARKSEVDISPLRHVADAFLCGRRRLVAPFVE